MISQLQSGGKSSWIQLMNDITFDPNNESAFELLQKLLSVCPRKVSDDPTIKELVENTFLNLLPTHVRPLIRATKFDTLMDMAKYYDRYVAGDFSDNKPTQDGKNSEVTQLSAKLDEVLTHMSRGQQPFRQQRYSNQRFQNDNRRPNFQQNNQFPPRFQGNYSRQNYYNQQQFQRNQQFNQPRFWGPPKQQQRPEYIPTDTRPQHERNPQFTQANQEYRPGRQNPNPPNLCYIHERYKDKAFKCYGPPCPKYHEGLQIAIPRQTLNAIQTIDKNLPRVKDVLSNTEFLIDSGSAGSFIPAKAGLLAKFPEITAVPNYNREPKHPIVARIPLHRMPAVQKARRVRPEYFERMKKQLEDMCRRGIIRRAQSQFGMPVHLVAQMLRMWPWVQCCINLLKERCSL
uniref:Uncharacterized protein LOC100186429 n=1 Tax=Phallusia mammillata TaxID=59560 RepID=A0A6F9DJB7_9ASCI|nr:uncharacterized protein LOC100186429 [Phallusia mammillata]